MEKNMGRTPWLTNCFPFPKAKRGAPSHLGASPQRRLRPPASPTPWPVAAAKWQWPAWCLGSCRPSIWEWTVWGLWLKKLFDWIYIVTCIKRIEFEPFLKQSCRRICCSCWCVVQCDSKHTGGFVILFLTQHSYSSCFVWFFFFCNIARSLADVSQKKVILVSFAFCLDLFHD